jgi:hypothetical protein
MKILCVWEVGSRCAGSSSSALTWKSEYASVAVYHSIDVLEKIHGHGGRTAVRWVDFLPAPKTPDPT